MDLTLISNNQKQQVILKDSMPLNTSLEKVLQNNLFKVIMILKYLLKYQEYVKGMDHQKHSCIEDLQNS